MGRAADDARGLPASCALGDGRSRRMRAVLSVSAAGDATRSQAKSERSRR